MDIFMTGATGFVGRPLVRALLADGHRVRAWVRNPERAKGQFADDGSKGVALVATAGGESAMAEAVEGCDAVINLAGESVAGKRWSAEHRRRIRESRTGTTRALVAACAAATRPPAVFVSTSASGYYGDGGDRELGEDAPAGDDFLAGVCRDWEQEARAAEGFARVVLVRVGIVLGEGGGALEKLVTPVRYGAGAALGSGRQYMPWIHLDDVVRIYQRVLTDASMVGPINASAPYPVSNRELTTAIGRRLRRPTFMRVPGFVLRTLLGEFAEVLLGGQRMLPRVLVDAGFSFNFERIDAAIEDLL